VTLNGATKVFSLPGGSGGQDISFPCAVGEIWYHCGENGQWSNLKSTCSA